MMSAACFAQYAEEPHRNMAIDEWLFQRAMSRPGTVFLRLYTWQPGAVTFGLNQKVERAVDRKALGATALIRRVTGGRALYHDPSELTYAVVVNLEGLEGHALCGDLTRTLSSIAAALTAFLESLGMRSQYLRQSTPVHRQPEYFHTAPCFDSVARHEITVDNRKVIASAQRRIGTTLLQHGSIKLAGVAYHPALDGPACPPDRVEAPDPVGPQQFQEFSRSFFAAVGRRLDLACYHADFDAIDREGIARQTEEVQKKSCLRRDMIKQGTLTDSL